MDAAETASCQNAADEQASGCDDQQRTDPTAAQQQQQQPQQPQPQQQQCEDDERERLLRIAKKHVKQMMEEAVTKKFIHEESSSMISLCVAIEACLSHGLKRRALGLFKTNSSAALVQKLAKTCPSAQEVLDLVELEEKRIQVESQKQQARALHHQQLTQSRNNQQVNSGGPDRRHCSSDSTSNASSNSNYSVTSAQAAQINSSNQTFNLQQQRSQLFGQQSNNLQPSNSNIHKRNIWMKLALIERKLVPIIDHLAENASKYYEKDALISSKVCAQILSSLLVGPCALEFSRSKTNDYYQFEEPSADELLRRHQLSFPIACLCSQQTNELTSHGQLARSATDGSNGTILVDTSAPVKQLISVMHSSTISSDKNNNTGNGSSETTSRAASPICGVGAGQVTGNRKESQRKRPLALKSNVKTGALVTDCHHYSCQEISEHQHTRGYSFRCTSSSVTLNAPAQAAATVANSGQKATGGSTTNAQPAIATNNSNNNNQLTPSEGCTSGTTLTPNHSPQAQVNSLKATLESSVTTATATVVAQEWSLWSPRMLHETLHQNSKSRLLYAKNNVLLETQQSETIAGYLSLHQTTNDLILKWIPNQMINGSQRPSNACRCQYQSENSQIQCCECVSSNASPSNSNSTAEPSSRDRSVSRRSSCANINSNPCDKQPAVALGSSYLDLVVNLSVSRIVLMHCHFGSKPIQSTSAKGQSGQESQQQTGCTSQESNGAQVQLASPIEDTLILVEADGVQRAPFKFPKGGLRWFLSCLETGLGPDKYLEPAIRPDDLGCAPDPLQELTLTDSTLTSNGSESPSVASEPAGGRFDMLLRRLPSLKRGLRSNQQAEPSSKDSSRNQSPEPTLIARSLDSNNHQQVTFSRLANNYVYRIVTVQQPDWLFQTPPHSAVSVTSSASSSAAKSLCKQNNNNSNSVSNDSATRGQKFRWSLSRLTKFSNIYSNSASTTSSSSVVCGPMSDGFDADSMSFTNSMGKSTLENASLTDFTDGNSFEANNISEIENDTLKMFGGNKQYKTNSSQDYIRAEAKLNDLKKSTSAEIAALRTQSIQILCESMRKQILSRAFYGWLVYYRRAKLIRNHLVRLIKSKSQCYLLDCNSEAYKLACNGITWNIWAELKGQDELDEFELKLRVSQLVYYGGIENDELRAEIWPYLLEHYKFKDSDEAKANKDKSMRKSYEACAKDWTKIEAVVIKRDNELLMANMARAGSKQIAPTERSNEASATSCSESQSDIAEMPQEGDELKKNATDNVQSTTQLENKSNSNPLSIVTVTDDENTINDENVQEENTGTSQQKLRRAKLDRKNRTRRRRRRARLESTGSVGSDASITDRYGNNIHRIDKDVQRCDRNFYYFKDAKNLDKLRNIMCTYVWQHLDVGYVQGMCDLAAPFLVIFDDETMAHTCFSQLMKRMVANFPHGSAMDQHFESLKYLMQILDPKLFEILQCDGDYTHFYFCYRWLLLDFKRELVYADVYKVWEAIWSARHIVTDNFVVFVALAMVRYYRDIIIENNMDFTDTIKFFNEMAERHDAVKILSLARDCVVEVENLISTVVTSS